ncbi:MAG: beta-ketoacyl synthase chain length factor [Alphaproteobacteria bacterium]
MKLFINGIGFFAPNMPSWAVGKESLISNTPWQETDISYPAPTLLSPRERRRASPSVKIALAVAEEAVADSPYDATDLPVVFSSAVGEIAAMHNILEALSTEEGFVSPTRFHNSVHNTASGYWSIGSGSKQAATSLAAGENSFSAGLLKAAMQATVEQKPVLLVVFDVPCPAPLSKKRPCAHPLAIALILSPFETDTVGTELEISVTEKNIGDITAPQTEIGKMLLDGGNPTAKSMALFEVLAEKKDATVLLNAEQQQLKIAITHVK